MFGFFKVDPVKKAQNLYENKLSEAMYAQRSGNIELYAKLSKEAEILLDKLTKLEEK